MPYTNHSSYDKHSAPHGASGKVFRVLLSGDLRTDKVKSEHDATRPTRPFFQEEMSNKKKIRPGRTQLSLESIPRYPDGEHPVQRLKAWRKFAASE